MEQPTYHLNDLKDNAYIEMIGKIRQWVADSNLSITEADYDIIEELYGKLFDQMAWNFMWKDI